jgi:hypothetical protein
MKLHHRLFLLTGVFAWPACAAPDAMTSPDLPAESSAVATLGTTAGPIAASTTIDARAAACARDPRVVVGAVTVDTCVGADLFFREPFAGNGRTCATCHRVDRNLTIDPTFIATLPGDDPLFIAENDLALQLLEKPPQMHQFSLILENVDGLEDPTHKFVLRTVPHTLSLSTSVTRPTGGVNPPVDRTGWSGDGAPGAGALRDFMTGAIRQHYTKQLRRKAGVDFVFATDAELDRIDQFMRRIGRSNELTLTSVAMSDTGANAGRATFLGVGCNACHGNAGANVGGGNRNFNTGVESSRNPALAAFPIDGGFGTTPANPDGSFGDGTFNVPPLIEAADTGPFFHTATSIVGASGHNTATATTIEEAIAFYDTAAFHNAPDGFLINLSATDIDNVGRFLRGVNAAFNAAIAIKRIDAELAIIPQFHNTQIAIQLELIRLANVEVGDAIRVLSEVSGLNAGSLSSFRQASMLLTSAQSVVSETSRTSALTAARQLLSQGAAAIGTNLTFNIGEGSVMF